MANVLENTLQEHLNETIGNSGKRLIGAIKELKPRTQFVEGEYAIDRKTEEDASEKIREAVTLYFTEQGYKPTQSQGIPKTVSLLKKSDRVMGINITAPIMPSSGLKLVISLDFLFTSRMPFMRNGKATRYHK